MAVDVEALLPLKEDIAPRYYSPRELAALAVLPEHEQLSGFYRCWTRKEAVLKALGEGLARALDSFDVSIAADEVRLDRLDGEPDAPRSWRMAYFEPQTEFVGAVACRTGGVPMTVNLHRA